MKTKIKFSREGDLRLVGRLDMMRYPQKASRRAGLPVAYPESFHPHRIMSFAAPLGMGLGGKAECFDLRITEEGVAILHSAEAAEHPDREMAEGIRILSFLRLPGDSPSRMPIVHMAGYEILFRAVAPEDKIAGQFADSSAYRSLTRDEKHSLRVAVDELLQRKEIPVQKTGEEGNLRELGLRPMIHTLHCEGNRLRCAVAQGSEANLKPELLPSALFSLGIARPFAAMPRRVVRTELYGSTGKALESYGTVF